MAGDTRDDSTGMDDATEIDDGIEDEHSSGTRDRTDRGKPRTDDLYPRERYVLYSLARHGRMALADVADEVTVWEGGARLPDLPASEARTVYLSLYHTHVPRLRRRGLVGYALERDLVWLTDEARGLALREPSPVGPPE